MYHRTILAFYNLRQRYDYVRKVIKFNITIALTTITSKSFPYVILQILVKHFLIGKIYSFSIYYYSLTNFIDKKKSKIMKKSAFLLVMFIAI